MAIGRGDELRMKCKICFQHWLGLLYTACTACALRKEKNGSILENRMQRWL